MHENADGQHSVVLVEHACATVPALGVGLGLSTMAAAGFGNTVSDVVGIGLSSKIETFAERLGFQAPQNLTQAQRMTAAVRWAKVAGATGGVTVGCLLGMFPLLLGW